MFQGTWSRQFRATGSSRNPSRGEWVWKALAALAIGALLGALAALPYDRLLGLPGTTGTVLRSLVATVVLAGLNAGRAQDLTFDTTGRGAAHRPPERDRGQQLRPERSGIVGGPAPAQCERGKRDLITVSLPRAAPPPRASCQ